MSDQQLSECDESLVAAAETDLERLLSIEPSADFAARTRMRIAAERHDSRGGWLSWRIAFAAVAVVVVAVGAWVSLRRPEVTPMPAAVVAVAPSPQPPLPKAKPEEGLLVATVDVGAPRRAPAGASEARIARAESRAVSEPEVLVPPDQWRAVQRLLAMNNGVLRADMAAPQRDVSAEEGRGDVKPLVPPLVITNMAVPAIAVESVERPGLR